MTHGDEAELAVENQCCLLCDYWWVDRRQILTTETRGWCLSIGSHFEQSTPDDWCEHWKLHI